jgi:AraC-like DNA-binding protein
LILLNFLKLRRAEKLNQEVYASKDLVNLNWSRISLGFYLIFYLGIILSELVNPFVSELIFNISILTLVLYLGYYQINTISRYLSIAHDRIENNNQEEVVQEKTSVDDSKSNELFTAIDDLVESEQLFLKFDVSIHELGKRLEMNSKYLSQAINNQDGLNFNRFINAKRVRHASVLIQDKQFNNYSLEGIAKESGFRSKSTFNTTFKGIMGCTPSEYKKGKH